MPPHALSPDDLRLDAPGPVDLDAIAAPFLAAMAAEEADEQARTAAGPDPILFPPVALRARHDGWTPARQHEYLMQLSATGSISRAAEAVGMSRTAAWRLYRHPHAAAFREAWDTALAQAFEQVRPLLLERLVDGETEEVWKDGELIATRVKPCNYRVALRLFDRAEAIEARGRAEAAADAAAAREDALAIAEHDAHLQGYRHVSPTLAAAATAARHAAARRAATPHPETAERLRLERWHRLAEALPDMPGADGYKLDRVALTRRQLPVPMIGAVPLQPARARHREWPGEAAVRPKGWRAPQRR